jgi:hypothetical protein
MEEIAKNFDPAYCLIAEKLCRMGATDKELAEFFEITIEVLNAWRKDQPEFADAIVKGRLVADANVADSLYRSAIGYVQDVYDVRVVDDEVVTTVVKKYFPPDPTSMMFYLKNRQPVKWQTTLEEARKNTGKNGYIIVWPKNKMRDKDNEAGKIAEP